MTPGPEGDWKGDGAMSAMCCAMIPRCEFSCARGRVWGVECPFGMASAAFQTCPCVVFVAIALPVTCEGLVLSMLGIIRYVVVEVRRVPPWATLPGRFSTWDVFERVWVSPKSVQEERLVRGVPCDILRERLTDSYTLTRVSYNFNSVLPEHRPRVSPK